MLFPRTAHQSCGVWTSLSVPVHVSELRSPRNNYRRRNHHSQSRQSGHAVLEEDSALSLCLSVSPGRTDHSEDSTGSNPTCCSRGRRSGSQSSWCTPSPQSAAPPPSPGGGGTVGTSLNLSRPRQFYYQTAERGGGRGEGTFSEVGRAKTGWVYNLLLTDTIINQ